MAWFIGIMGTLFLLLFTAICVVDKIIVKENNDPEFHGKMETFRLKWKRLDPYTNFINNLFWWVMAFLVIYYIYLG
jgi:hypothetical protein